MKQVYENSLLQITQAKAILAVEKIQSLWSNYGEILRIQLQAGHYPSVVLKLVQIPDSAKHPRGWNTDIGHQRKVRSYEVEQYWYQDYAKDCTDFCPIPNCIALKQMGEEVLIVLEDLNALGFPLSKTSVNEAELKACLSWLAHFHANFMQRTPKGLWEIGTYWHLATRPDELAALDDDLLKKAAPLIDAKLNDAKFKTFVHGDAKLANFCFSEDGQTVAAVDFQYVGAGCGMKDVAYFLGSCLTEKELDQQADGLLDYYFVVLQKGLEGSKIPVDELEEEWRALYPFAVADFHRFLKGWSPGHWKINSYSERISRAVAESLVL
jgi:hypothetical protein